LMICTADTTFIEYPLGVVSTQMAREGIVLVSYL